MIAQSLFLVAYACSGLAGLIYEVSWTRLLTSYMGHTTAAASAVVAAFMGGLAVGAAVGGKIADRLPRRRCLHAYIALEALVVGVALVLPYELGAFTPLLRSTYANGDANLIFPVVRLLSCLVMMFVPAAALGATFPIAVRWYVGDDDRVGSSGGALYAANTAGAALGALAAGFVLIPKIGVAGTTEVGMAASLIAMMAVVLLTFVSRGEMAKPARSHADPTGRVEKRRAALRRGAKSTVVESDVARAPWLAAGVLGLTGMASLIVEITWTRVLALTMGPTIYAFSATLAVLIGGIACGSAAGAWIAARVRTPAAWLAVILAGAAMSASEASALAGGAVPLRVAQEVAASPGSFDQMLTRGAMLIAALIFPTAVGFGAAFPLAFAMLPARRPNDAGGTATEGLTTDAPASDTASELGFVYAINTVGAVVGSLAAGFLLIPHLGLQQTLRLASVLLVFSAAIVLFASRLSDVARMVGGLAAVGGVAMIVFSPPWDRDLLASGGYIYAPYAPKVLDLETALKAGTLLYYREGAAATVSVKRLTGTLSLAIDGKVDASTRSDMLTQRLVAHVPLLLHEHPKEICIIGLGSGVTLGSALRYPIERADVVELSPEVVEASRYFADENYHALDDPRTHLIVGDGRSHLLLSNRQYDAIISEPSNPWIAGVASLFTREFFSAARDRLAPGGVICQWAHTYNISDADLRSIVATFRSVFPGGTVWMIGEEDLLLVASNGPLDPLLSNIASNWKQPGVARDLASVSVREPFSILSLFVGGPSELGAYTQGASVFTDDRSALEFSAPKELHTEGASANASNLAALLEHGGGPDVVRQSRAQATAGNWHNRAVMMFKSDMFATAFADETKALDIDPADEDALNGIVDAAVMTGRYPEAMRRLTPGGRPAEELRGDGRPRQIACRDGFARRRGDGRERCEHARSRAARAARGPRGDLCRHSQRRGARSNGGCARTCGAIKSVDRLLRGGFSVSSREVFRRRRAHQDRNRVRSVVRRRVRSRRRRRSEAGARRGGARGV